MEYSQTTSNELNTVNYLFKVNFLQYTYIAVCLYYVMYYLEYIQKKIILIQICFSMHHKMGCYSDRTCTACFKNKPIPANVFDCNIMHNWYQQLVLNSVRIYGSSIIVIIFTSVHSVRWGGGQGRSYPFLNVVYSDGNEIIAHVRRTSMTKNPLVRNSLLVQKLVT